MNATEALVPIAPTPLDLLKQAIAQGVSIEQLERLQGMVERHEANEARKAYVEAMNAFKKNPPTITKNKDVAFGNTKYSHATLDHVCDAVTKGLSEVGISHRWTVEQNGEWIKVVCILTHSLGHSEQTQLMGAPDNSGSKNSIQAIASTVTYLQRYTLLAATGLAAGGTDNDGRGDTSKPHSLSREKVDEQCEWIANARNIEELQSLYKNAYREAAAINDKSAMARYIAAKDARKKEL